MVEYQENKRRIRVRYLQRRNEYERGHENLYKGSKSKNIIKINLRELEALLNKTSSGE